jgi:hypothetical protein
MFQHSDRVRHAGQSPIGPGNTFKLSRELSVGDVVRVSTSTAVCWSACDGLGWSTIAPPSNVHAISDSTIGTTCGSTTCGSDQQRTEP